MPSRRHLALLTLGILVLAAGFLGGCGAKSQGQPSATSAQPAAVAAAPLTLMTAEEKVSQIATSFPIQVPVAAGSVVRGEAQGDSAWIYQIIVPGDVAGVQAWYLRAYQNASWTPVSGSETQLALEKGSAQSQLSFEKVNNGNEARTQVTASVGVGTTVLRTQ